MVRHLDRWADKPVDDWDRSEKLPPAVEFNKLSFLRRPSVKELLDWSEENERRHNLMVARVVFHHIMDTVRVSERMVVRTDSLFLRTRYAHEAEISPDALLLGWAPP